MGRLFKKRGLIIFALLPASFMMAGCEPNDDLQITNKRAYPLRLKYLNTTSSGEKIVTDFGIIPAQSAIMLRHKIPDRFDELHYQFFDQNGHLVKDTVVSVRTFVEQERDHVWTLVVGP